MKFQSLTNVRPTKDLGCQIIAAPTEGQFKVTPDAAQVLGVSSGDYLQIGKDMDGNIFALKGEEGRGGKLASANKSGGGTLTFSAANAWDALDGDTDHNSHYELSTTGVTNDEDPEDNNVYYALTFSEKVAKIARKNSTSSNDGGGENLTAEPVAEVTSFDDI